jgi:two-component system, OmpR family, response regulator TctD
MKRRPFVVAYCVRADKRRKMVETPTVALLSALAICTMNTPAAPAEKVKLLLVEDDPALGQALALALARRGYVISQATDGVTALNRARNEKFSAVVLDLTLPELDGMEVLKALRADGKTVPVIVLTARSAVGDRVQGLRMGADDYLSKPFDIDELEARIQALLRRGGAAAQSSSELGGLTVDRAAGACYSGGVAVELSSREFAMLAALIERPGHAVTRDRLWQAVFADGSEAQPDAIEVVAYRLRKKIAACGVELVALRGVGYLLRERRALT